ncbi:nicotinic acid mononucleotide adenylyltransferase [Candidatus Pantoea edessiphila]|uniref:Probable nicotinate-nucleotide adenylyltransferase n=1 Tax=Candidatus Pantoea edessiphila TaxID=2044610 RepID=A0A2P5T2C0_9GAMM|nr:nicotinate-nucleotide adenylyltransferase [Candidatus Pantoea edessiphila]PPI88716.1 nicotinic acid mononucleotide adenylyltransferase [Candidatus Pantoea edessiphila]
MSCKIRTIFGGTFDPIHFGHLYTAKILATKLRLERIFLLPNCNPPHRLLPEANAIQRINMIRYAIEREPLFKIDSRELQYETPSWTVSTLENIRTEFGNNQSIAFIIGYDSLLNLNKWYRWQDILSLCHLLVCKRRYYKLSNEKKERFFWINKYVIQDIKNLYLKPSGYIWLADTPFFNISSSEIRILFKQNKPCNNLLPQVVIDYILKYGLYKK